MNGALDTLKILDFTTLLPGPLATMMMADLGADVLRIESPHRPDLLRFSPPLIDGTSAAHLYLNRSKRSLALNLKHPESVEIIQRLLDDYDIIVEQFRPGVMARLGLDYETLSKENPRLIYCSITGYGQTGPYRNRAGHDLNYMALSGAASYNGRKETGPIPSSLQSADVAGGSYQAVMGILAAVIHRGTTGEGQHVDVSMTDGAFAMQALTAPAALTADIEPTLEEFIFNGGSFYDYYETADGRHLSVASLEPKFFDELCDVLNLPHYKGKSLTPDPAFQRQMKKEIAAVIKKKTFDEWNGIFRHHDCCVEPVLTFSEAAVHPQITARRMVAEVPHGESTQRQTASPFHLSATPPRYGFTGVAAGAHSIQVLQELGYVKEDIDSLLQRGAVHQP